MATHSSTLAWKIPWAEEPGRLQSMGLHRVGHDWSDSAAAAAVLTGLSSFYDLKNTVKSSLLFLNLELSMNGKDLKISMSLRSTFLCGWAQLPSLNEWVQLLQSEASTPEVNERQSQRFPKAAEKSKRIGAAGSAAATALAGHVIRPTHQRLWGSV